MRAGDKEMNFEDLVIREGHAADLQAVQAMLAAA